ncbi:MAG: YtxH domain-containing protein [Nitrospirales bacterium]
MMSQGVQIKTVAALVAGAAVVGAGVGLLCTPKSGADSRRDISRYAKKTQEEATRLGNSVKSSVDKAMEYGKTLLPK